ncbi:CHAP domain-containing protein [Nonomuraea sp. NPDC059023]|uniref:CHAP domain-containing protein n=1 Tax=unclassified Nonomuraea TaxID=2593643 RepID=UPI0036D19868
MSVTAMLTAARATLGTQGRPNGITRAYATRHGAAFLTAPWCNMSVTEWARRSDNAAAVLPRGDRAYTVWHAQDGKELRRWFAGTADNLRKHAKPGAIVFFDWSRSDSIGAIDHVGIVERNLGDGRIQTIEGNTRDACRRRVRAASVIAGFWNPPYKTPSKPSQPKPQPALDWMEEIVKKLPALYYDADKPLTGWHVKTLTGLLEARGYPVPDTVDATVFTRHHDKQLREFQKAAGVADQAGRTGPPTWAALLKVA